MIDTQKQEAAPGSTAYQAKGDLTVNQGATPEQIGEIIGAITKQLSHFAAEARAIAEERCNEFRQEILSEMAKPEFAEHSEAFRDPDFQFVLSSSLNEFARKGDDDLKLELVRLLMERATKTAKDRLGLVLNEAIQVTPKLTNQDKSVLVILFVIKNVFITSQYIEPVYHRYQQLLSAYVSNLPSDNGCFEYLSSIGCLNVELVADHYPLNEHFHKQYAQLFPKTGVPGPPVPGQTVPSNFEMPATAQQVWDGFLQNVPALGSLNAVWQSALYRHSTPTAIGKTIAHGVLVGHGNFDAPLEVFVT